MTRAQELGQGPFAVLDAEIGWLKLLSARRQRSIILGSGEVHLHQSEIFPF